jgi:uncharacterized membrane protein
VVDAGTAAIPLLVAGNPVAIVVIARWVPVVRERRTRWFVVHALAMLAIIAGWALRRPAAVPLNVVWLLVSTAWYLLAGRRPAAEGGRGGDEPPSRRRPAS